MYPPRKGDPDCLQELRWMYDRRELKEARRDLAAWLSKWQGKYGPLCDWVEENGSKASGSPLGRPTQPLRAAV